MARRGVAAAVASVVAISALLVVFSLNDDADVIHEDTGDFALEVHQHGGNVELAGGWCLNAPQHAEGAQLGVAKCDAKSQQSWAYNSQSGLVELSGSNLCLHADYVSEPEGALLSLQKCSPGSDRQAYALDAKARRMHMRKSPQLCLHSVDASLSSGQPVLLLPCTNSEGQRKVTEQASNVDKFVSSPMNEEDKAFESGVMKEVMTEAAKASEKTSQTERKHSAQSQAPSTTVQGEKSVDDQINDIVAWHKDQESQLLKDTDKDRTHPTSQTGQSVSPTVMLGAGMHEQLTQLAEEEKQKLRQVISNVRHKFHDADKKAAEEEKRLKNNAHDVSLELQHQAKIKTEAVISKARKDLRTTLKATSATLTDSVDQRQRARAKLVELQSQNADEVMLAQAALHLAKVNKATRASNTKARAAAKLAHSHAARTINFAKTILASRLKAIQTTEQLSVNKAELHSHAVRTEAEEALSRATQSVLMALDDEKEIRLEDIVGGNAVAPSVQGDLMMETGMDDVGAGSLSSSVGVADSGDSIKEVDDDVDDELLGKNTASLSGAAEDTVYTSKMHKCKFPFVYNGQKFYHCKDSMHGSWCATHVDGSRAVKKWDYCIQNQHTVALAKRAAMEAAKIEVQRVLAATGAQLTPDALRESLRAAAAAQTRPQPEEDTSETPEEEDLKDRHPTQRQDQAAARVDEIINETH